MIVLKNICFRYEDTEVVKNCSMSFVSDEIHLLLGPNGAGKTTLAMILKGLLKPSYGRVFSPRGKISEWRKKMGFLFQFPEDLFFNDTVYDEIAYGAKKFEMEDVDRKLNNIIDFLGLDPEILKSSPFDLSYGEKRIVAFASILIWEPSYLILDEPFSGLDWQFRNRLAEVIESLRGRVGVVIISQELDNVISFVDRVSLIVRGELVFSSPIEEVDWDGIYEAGCDIPSAVRLGNKIKRNGINLNTDVCPYTLQGLIDALKG
jgi:energy-coupling factor transport system ATP-binding protein